MPDVLDLLRTAPLELALALAAVVLLVESGALVGMFLPGATTALTLGLVTGAHGASLPAAAGVVFVATATGSQLRFLLASARSGDATPRGPRPWRAARARLARETVWVRALVARRPVLAVVLGRCVGGVRTVVPVLAARSGTPAPRFVAADLVAAAAWSTTLVVAGFLAGTRADQLSWLLAVAGVAAQVAVAALLVVVRRRALAPPATTPEPRTAPLALPA